ncbi:MAG: hypothetical protein ACLRPT_02485 [Akkermansia muciniphila]
MLGPWILWALMRNKEKRIIDLPSILFIALGSGAATSRRACSSSCLRAVCGWRTGGLPFTLES